MRPLVSIIMPVYNAAGYVKDAVESVLVQTYSNWELIIVNDGSTDNSELHCVAFDDSRITYCYQKNGGVSKARNTALGMMQGDFFCFLDADDQLTPHSLESRVNILINSPSITFVDGQVEVMNSDFTKALEVRKQKSHENPLDALLKVDNSVFFGPTWMIRKIPNMTYRFKEQLTHAEDLLFYLSIAHIGKYHAVDEVVYRYRSGNESAMTNLDGLWNGYKTVAGDLNKLAHVSMKKVKEFKQIVSLIMFKSYMGNGKPIKAIGVFWDYFWL